MLGYMFLLGLIVGLIIAGVNNFNVYEQNDDNELWIRHLIYLMSTFIGFSVNIMFISFIILIPASVFANLYDLINRKRIFFNLAKISLFYFWFAFIALSISSLQYLFKDSFFAFASDYSNHPNPLEYSTSPTLYYAAYHLLNLLFAIKGLKFGIYFIGSLIILIMLEILIIVLLSVYNNRLLHKLYNLSLKMSSKTSSLSYVSPIFMFTSLTTSLAVQPIATFLRISLIILLMFIVTNIIVITNYIYLLLIRRYKIRDLFSIFLDMTKTIFFSKSDNKVNEMKSKWYLSGIDKLSNLKNYYNIFLTTIFSLVIISYLGFSSGPLFDSWFTTYEHAIYWICLFVYGYILIFCYSLRFREISPYKIMLASSTPYIRTGFNTGILSFFNNVINLFASFAMANTYLVLVTFKRTPHSFKITY